VACPALIVQNTSARRRKARRTDTQERPVRSWCVHCEWELSERVCGDKPERRTSEPHLSVQAGCLHNCVSALIQYSILCPLRVSVRVDFENPEGIMRHGFHAPCHTKSTKRLYGSAERPLPPFKQPGPKTYSSAGRSNHRTVISFLLAAATGWLSWMICACE